ncbi:Uncharacterized protein TCM_014134 [Theobroma cacao]|uniref:Uncharacterized protein n=1 Tax=Theobroma cacao TaxID=3641 RepID=A0A061FYK5_THECC|nr:Uncharacterized protein TCM_014134 [Theobroma cacao]
MPYLPVQPFWPCIFLSLLCLPSLLFLFCTLPSQAWIGWLGKSSIKLPLTFPSCAIKSCSIELLHVKTPCNLTTSPC